MSKFITFIFLAFLLLGWLGGLNAQNTSPEGCNCKSACMYKDKVIDPSDIQIFKQVPYGEAINYAWGPDSTPVVTRHMNIQKPKSEVDSGRPLWVNVHGGGYLDKGNPASGMAPKGTESTVRYGAQAGYVYVDLGYRLGWNPNYGTCGLGITDDNPAGDNTGALIASYQACQDLYDALAFLTENAEQYNIDPTQVFLTGGSAGAVTIDLATYYTEGFLDTVFYPIDSTVFRKLGPIDSSGFNRENIKAIAPNSGFFSDLNLLLSRDVPILLNASSCDQTVNYWFGTEWYCEGTEMASVPRYGSRLVADFLWANQRYYKLNTIVNGGHLMKGYSTAGQFTTDSVAAFFYGQMYNCAETTWETWAVANDPIDYHCNKNDCGAADTLQPFLVAPANGATLSTPNEAVFRFQSVYTANAYILQVARDVTFQHIVETDTLPAILYTDPQLLVYTPNVNWIGALPNKATLYWRVRGANTSQPMKTFAWSNTGSFRILTAQ